MSDPRKFHLSILIGNALSTILTATTATLFVLKVIQNSQLNRIWVLGLTMVIVTLVLLLLSRIPSKILSVRNPRALSQKLSLINNLTYLLIYPVSALLERATVFMGRILKVEGDPFSLSEEEVKSMIELGEEKGTIHTEEKEDDSFHIPIQRNHGKGNHGTQNRHGLSCGDLVCGRIDPDHSRKGTLSNSHIRGSH
jgi:putative hemolysin